MQGSWGELRAGLGGSWGIGKGEERGEEKKMRWLEMVIQGSPLGNTNPSPCNPCHTNPKSCNDLTH
jgi:hypothetical protein